MLRYALVLSFLLAASAALAQTPGSCVPGTASDTLRINDVAAPLMNNGLLFDNVDTSGAFHGYRVAYPDGSTAISNASLWVGGRVDGDLRVAGSIWGYDGFEFWPGPLDEGATLPDPSDCSAYDRIWTVSAEDLAAYEDGAAPTADLAEWPVGLGAPAVDASGAPVEPVSRDQTVDLAAGERPVVFGSQTAFWVMNDVGNVHEVTGSAPLGVEVAVTAFAVASNDLALDRSTFFRYAITNRNSQPIEDAYVSFYADPDLLGGADYTGADTVRAMGYAYHAIDGGITGPEAFGVDLLGGSVDGEPDLASFVYFGGSGPTDSHPDTAEEYYRVMRGVWPDGTPMRAFGDGYEGGGEPTTISLPGDPVTGQFWSDENTGNGRGDVDFWDRRFVLSTGPGTLSSGETWTVDLGLLYALGPDRLGAVVELRAASDLVQEMYDDGSLFETTAIPDRVEVTAPPVLVSPTDEAGPFEEAVTFEWEPVADATEYDFQWSRSETFGSFPSIRLLTTTSWTGIPGTAPGTVYWRVRGRQGGALGPYSEIRSLSYDGARSQLSEVLGVVEVASPNGADPCGEAAQSKGGCPSPGEQPSIWKPGNNVYYLSANSTGEYSVFPYGGAGSLNTVGAFAPNDFEIRFVSPDEGAYAYYGFTTGRITRVPFQVWDIGAVAPGEENDPADDVQLIPLLAPFGEECTFAFDGPPVTGDDAVTARIYAHYPVGDDYAAWEALAAPLAADCLSSAAPTSDTAADLIDFDRGRPIQRDVIVPLNETVTVADLEGAVIRYYTNDSFGTAEEEAPASAAVLLGAPYPNPASRFVSVPYSVTAPGRVRLAVLDVLGREVAVLVDGVRSAGAHETRLDAARLAAGVYVVVLETASGRASRTVTVVR